MPFSLRSVLLSRSGTTTAYGGRSERERVIRRIAQLNAEVTRLQQIADESDLDADVVEAYRSVHRLRVSMARDELGAAHGELIGLARRLAVLDGTAPPPMVAPSPKLTQPRHYVDV